MEKLFVSYEKIHKLIKKISNDIISDNWVPDCIIAISAGGFIPSRLLRNYIKKDIYVVGLKRYLESEELHEIPVKIQWIDEVEKKLKRKKILLIDEVDDTRVTLNFCLNELLKNSPEEIRVAVIHQKIKHKKGEFPDKIKKIYIGEKIPDIWIIYPWDALDIEEHNRSCEDLKQN